MSFPRRYAPGSLTRRDRRRQLVALKKSRAAYREGRFVDRPKLKSYRSRKSKHVKKFVRAYGVKPVAAKSTARATGCRLSTLKAIVRRGRGAFYSSGSRPNQTATSWGRARLASALTGGPASKSDADLLAIDPGCGV